MPHARAAYRAGEGICRHRVCPIRNAEERIGTCIRKEFADRL
jgi:hypothetical protein